MPEDEAQQTGEELVDLHVRVPAELASELRQYVRFSFNTVDQLVERGLRHEMSAWLEYDLPAGTFADVKERMRQRPTEQRLSYGEADAILNAQWQERGHADVEDEDPGS